MSEITLSLEHPSLGCGEIIARYDLSEIQEKAYQQGRADLLAEIESKYMMFDDDGKTVVCVIKSEWEQLKQTEHIADADKMIETETWNSMHGKVVMPKGTFDKLYELAKQNEEQDDV